MGDHRLPAEHRVLKVCKAVEHSCSTIVGHALRSTVRPVLASPKDEDRVPLVKRAYRAHHLVQRGGALWSPHHALMHGPSCEPLTSKNIHPKYSFSPQDDRAWRDSARYDCALSATKPIEPEGSNLNPRRVDKPIRPVADEIPGSLSSNPEPPNPSPSVLTSLHTDGSRVGTVLTDGESSGGQIGKDGRHLAIKNASAKPHSTSSGLIETTSGIARDNLDPCLPSATSAEEMSCGPTGKPSCPSDLSGVEPSGAVESKGDMLYSNLIRNKVQSQLIKLRQSHSIPLVEDRKLPL